MRDFIRNFFEKLTFRKRLSLSEKRLSVSRRKWKSVSRFIRKKEKQLNAIYKEFMDVKVDLENQIQQAKLIVRDQEELISSLRDQLRTSNEITIPALVDINKLLNERIEASTAAEIRSKLSSRIE